MELGLVSVCAMVLPEPAEGVVIEPVLVPSVQVKLLLIPAVKAIFVAVPLHILAVFAVVTAGAGLTVTVIG